MMKHRNRYLRQMSGLGMAFALTVTQALSAAAGAETSSLLSTALTLTENDFENNQGTILVLLQNCLNAAQGDEALERIVSSIALLLENGSADAASVEALLRSALDLEADVQTQIAETEDSAPGTGDEEAASSQGDDYEVVITRETNAQPQTSKRGLPIFEVASYIRTLLPESVIVAVPKNWGNNGTGKALTTFSPVNASGAISPAAGTLSITCFPMEQDTPQEAYDAYVKSIADMSVVADVTQEDAYAADLPAKKIDFAMNVGANQFTCETICFAYDETVYAIELMQGQQTEYDYFPVYDQVVESAEVGSADEIAAVLSWVEDAPEETQIPEQTDAPQEPEGAQEEGIQDTPQEPEGVPEDAIQDTPQEPEGVQEEGIQDTPQQPDAVQEDAIQDTPQSEEDGFVRHEVTLQSEGGAGEDASAADTGLAAVDADSAALHPDLPADMGTFMYEMDGQVYQFPTSVSQLQAPSLQLDYNLQIPYDFSSDHDMTEGSWTELVNTQYFYFENAFYKEMAGVTNLKGYPVPMSECMLTALIDTQGSYVDVTLPGGIRVGSPETDIIKGFPEFEGRTLDGLAGFRENELLYACNVRDDGCHGYVLIRNDDPYYSAVSIICDQGVVIEISFECIGSVRATGVFL